MKRFRFRLESVLKWRLLELEIEEAKLQELFAELRRLEARQANLASAKAEAERTVLGQAAVEAQELAALDAHRRWAVAERARLAGQARDCETRIGAQRERVGKAEQKLRLLEKLKGRRLAEWTAGVDQEYEALAAEAFLATWRRRS